MPRGFHEPLTCLSLMKNKWKLKIKLWSAENRFKKLERVKNQVKLKTSGISSSRGFLMAQHPVAVLKKSCTAFKWNVAEDKLEVNTNNLWSQWKLVNVWTNFETEGIGLVFVRVSFPVIIIPLLVCFYREHTYVFEHNADI